MHCPTSLKILCITDCASWERKFTPVPLVSDVYLWRAGEEGWVVRCLAKRKRGGHPPQLRIVCRVYTHDNGLRQTHRQEVRRDTYDITTSTWRMKPCTAYVMRGPAGSYAAQPVIFSTRVSPDYVFTIHLTAETPSFLEAAHRWYWKA